jgi:hypothetical protein
MKHMQPEKKTPNQIMKKGGMNAEHTQGNTDSSNQQANQAPTKAVNHVPNRHPKKKNGANRQRELMLRPLAVVHMYRTPPSM